MKLYITYTKNSFTEKQIQELSRVGELIFLEDTFDLDKAPYLPGARSGSGWVGEQGEGRV